MGHDKSTREQIIEVADELFYKKGFEHTSFAHIADEVGISRGNFYHHFKSKDEILDAVIDLRLTRTQEMLDQWENDGKSPSERIRSFIHILIMNQAKIKLYGCPVGTLCAELSKLNHDSKAQADQIMSLFRTWLKKQFIALGLKKEADELAMHLLMRSQGVAALTHTFQDEKFVKHEVKQMEEWLAACAS